MENGSVRSKPRATITSVNDPITLFAALNVLDGAIIAQCKPRQRHQEFLVFLRRCVVPIPIRKYGPVAPARLA
jgi:hypothetical protein